MYKAENEPEVETTHYRKLVGSLQYLLHTHIDLAYSVRVVSCYMQSPKESHAHAIKKILHYLHGTPYFGILYKRSINICLLGYCNSSHNIDINYGRSTTEHVKHP